MYKKNKKKNNKVLKKESKNWLIKNFPFLMFGAYILWAIYFAIDPVDRAVWWAENIPVMFAAGIIMLTYKKFRFSNTSYFLMFSFLMYHTYGGHYTFEKAPFETANNFLNQSGCSLFSHGVEGGNSFDRVGHFMIGIFAYPLAELVYRKKWVSNIWTAILFGIFALGFWGSLYEIIEMVYAVQEGGSAGAAFLGSQGDIWDAQKDMALDILGATLISVLFWWNYKKK